MKTRILIPVIIILLIATAYALVSNRQSGQHYLDSTPTGGDFILQTSKGPFNLEDYRGKVILIYFGYTFCPDICPTNLAIMTQALNALEEQELEQIQPVFISVDPDRDTMSHLDNYTAFFHSKLLGMTGSKESIDKIAAQYGAAYRKVTGESEGGYLVDHSSFTYLINQQGKLKESFAHATNPQTMVDTIRTYLTH